MKEGELLDVVVRPHHYLPKADPPLAEKLDIRNLLSSGHPCLALWHIRRG